MIMDNSNISYEPMDVDTSGNSTSKMDISNDSSDKSINNISSVKNEKDDSQIFFEADASLVHTTNDGSNSSRIQCNVKRYHIKIERQTRDNSHLLKLNRLYFFALFLLICSVLTHYSINIACTEDNNVTYIEEMLSSNIFGQENAVKKIVNALSVNVRSKIIFLYGSTGVGKTLAASVISERFRRAMNFYHYTMPHFVNTFATEFMFGLAFCTTSMVVVDDLRPKDMDIKPAISSLLERSEGLSKNITLILIFNCEDVSENFKKKCGESFLQQLKETFHDIKAEKTYVKFNKLTNEHLKQCIEKELKGKEIGLQKMTEILKNFDVSLDGCKGVHTRIKFLNFS